MAAIYYGDLTSVGSSAISSNVDLIMEYGGKLYKQCYQELIDSHLSDYFNGDAEAAAKFISSYLSNNNLLSLSDLEGYITSNDLEGYITSNDLEGYITSDYLEGYITSNDLEGYITSNDLEGYITSNDLVSRSDIEDFVKYNSLSIYLSSIGYLTSAQIEQEIIYNISSYITSMYLDQYLSTKGYLDTYDLIYYMQNEQYIRASDLDQYFDNSGYLTSYDLQGYVSSYDLRGYITSNDLEEYITSNCSEPINQIISGYIWSGDNMINYLSDYFYRNSEYIREIIGS